MKNQQPIDDKTLQREITQRQEAADEMIGSSAVPLGDLLNKKFLRENTTAHNFEEFWDRVILRMMILVTQRRKNSMPMWHQ